MNRLTTFTHVCACVCVLFNCVVKYYDCVMMVGE